MRSCGTIAQYQDISVRPEIEASSLLLVSQAPEIQKFVLLEEQENIRAHYRKMARKKGLVLWTYDQVDEFLNEINQFGYDTWFFVGEKIGLSLGVEVAKIIKNEIGALAVVSLVTHMPKHHFLSEIENGVLDGVFGKFPFPFEYSENGPANIHLHRVRCE